MTLRSFKTLLLFSAAGLGTNLLPAADLHGHDSDGGSSRAVYLMTNQTTNSILVLDRAGNGALTMRGSFATGGAGGLSPSGNPLDPLASQSSLLLSNDSRLLFAVNAGSNTISVMSVAQNGLEPVDIKPSGGLTPVSVTQSRNLLYVLNAGGEPNISGFRITASGKLAAIPNSTRRLPGGAAGAPAQVGFTPDGDLLVVTEKSSNTIDVFQVDRNGVPSEAVTHPSSGLTPFGFSYARADTLVVAEAFGGSPLQSAVSSYEVSEHGDLDPLSASVADHQTAACWIAISSRGKFAYTTNTGTGVVSGFRISGNGHLQPLNTDGVAARTGDATNPIDMAITEDLLYVHLNGPNGRAIAIYRIGPDGSLTLVGRLEGMPVGAQGIAAR